MITAIVRFGLPRPISRDQARELFSASAMRYRDVPGLLNKTYLLSEDGASVGGVYLWRTRQDAVAFFDADWYTSIHDRYDAVPFIEYFSSPVVVDNIACHIETDA